MIVVPYVPGMLRQQTYDAVRAYVGDDSFLYPHEPGGFHYSDLLRRLWRMPGDLVIVEQDMVPTPADFHRLLACERPWCGHMTLYIDHYLGETHSLVKYSAELRAQESDCADRALTQGHTKRPMRCLAPGEANTWPEGQYERWPTDVPWLVACDAITAQLRNHGHRWHLHSPPVPHLHYDPEPVYWNGGHGLETEQPPPANQAEREYRANEARLARVRGRA